MFPSLLALAAACAARGAQGRSKFGGRAGLDDEARAVAVQRQRALLAPLLAADHRRSAVGRRIAGRHDDGGAPAILLERVGRECVGDEAAIGELADAA